MYRPVSWRRGGRVEWGQAAVCPREGAPLPLHGVRVFGDLFLPPSSKKGERLLEREEVCFWVEGAARCVQRAAEGGLSTDLLTF